MDYTTLPSSRGQITLSAKLREKYGITPDTPIVIVDKGNGKIELRIMKAVPHTEAEYYETDKEIGVNFPKGIDPRVLIEYIKKIDG